MLYKCPNCNQELIIDKYKLVKCNNCKKDLLLTRINNKIELIDVTPDKEVSQ